MRALAIGILAALVLAGPKLYGFVQDGSMSGTGAMLRGGVLAVGCALGVAVVSSIVRSYRAQQEAAAEAAEAAEAAAAEAADHAVEG